RVAASPFRLCRHRRNRVGRFARSRSPDGGTGRRPRSSTGLDTWSRKAPPGDPNGIDLNLAAQIERDPLRMVLLACELLREIGIALPITVQIAVREPRIAGSIASAEATVRKRCGPGVADHLCGGSVPDEVASLCAGIAPLALCIPVPGFR